VAGGVQKEYSPSLVLLPPCNLELHLLSARHRCGTWRLALQLASRQCWSVCRLTLSRPTSRCEDWDKGFNGPTAPPHVHTLAPTTSIQAAPHTCCLPSLRPMLLPSCHVSTWLLSKHAHTQTHEVAVVGGLGGQAAAFWQTGEQVACFRQPL
jgi:hypothetical protein